MQGFIEFVQNYSKNKKMKSDIQFTFNQSTEEVNFLDGCVKLNEGDISTTVKSNPTDFHLYLNSNSNHPRHVIRNIPKSQFLRLKRICSNPADFAQKSSTYAQYFISRGYDKANIEGAIREVAKEMISFLINRKRRSRRELCSSAIGIHTWGDYHLS